MFPPFDQLREMLWLSLRVTDEDEDWSVAIDGFLADYEDARSTTGQEKLLHHETRAVLESQIETLDDIDDKAARTVRITALLVGAVFGAVSFGDASSLVVNQYTWWGGVSLVVTVVLGMTTYSQSSPYVGPKPDDLRRLSRATDSSEQLVERLLSDGYQGWVEYNGSLNRIDSYFLALTQWALATSLVLFGAGLSGEFARGVSSLPKVPAFAVFSRSVPFLPLPLTPASSPVVLLLATAVVVYLYSLAVKYRMR